MLQAISLALGAALAAPCLPSDDTPLIAHRALAEEVLQRFGIDPAGDPSAVSLDTLLVERFFHARVGALDLAVDASLLADKSVAQDLLAMAAAAARLQARFLEQLGGAGPEAKQALKDAEVLVTWFGQQRGDNLASAAQGAAGELLTTLSPRAAVAESAARFEAYMTSCAVVGAAQEGLAPEVVLLAPKRRHFHELLGLFGWLSPDLQGTYWHDGTVPWTNTYYNGVTAIALEYHSGDQARGAVFDGLNVNERNPTAMQQQVTQLAANSLLTHLYGDRVPAALVNAMAINLVVDLFGECATRVDGDLRQRRTEAREVFIPGGASEGGLLPTNFANSRFRGEEGKDRFVVALKGCQSAGGTQAKQERKKGKDIHFQLWDDSQAQRAVIAAPFLGSAAVEQPPVTAAYLADAAEFFRAYRTAFLHWLETQAGGSKKKSAEAYGKLLQGLARLDSAADLERLVTDVYGKPLSSAEPGKDDLEGRFLAWLAKQ